MTEETARIILQRLCGMRTDRGRGRSLSNLDGLTHIFWFVGKLRERFGDPVVRRMLEG